jgi:Holliday junction DNA helicase RuvA
MIARIAGILSDLDGGRALIDPGHGLVYEVLLPGYAATRLAASIGKPVELHTLQFIEATAQGATMFPRLAGFPSLSDKAFFELFVTCKGIGHRRAMRAMVLTPATLAAAIADRDVKLIQTMPEVGKKLAETIVVTLRDKVEKFVSESAYPESGQADASPDDTSGDGDTNSGGNGISGGGGGGRLAREALEILLQLGEQRGQAVQWIDRVLATGDAPDQPQDVIAAVYRLRASE